MGSNNQRGNGVFSNCARYAPALPAGVAIGPGGRFDALASAEMANDIFQGNNLSCHGPWKEARDKYLGLKFEIDGEIHFGWARLSVSCVVPHAARVLLTGYAYETVVGQPIVTGETGTAEERSSSAHPTDSPAVAHLALLALGSPGFSRMAPRGDGLQQIA